MAFRDTYDFSPLVNEKENWIIEEVGRQLADRPEICRCQECVLDMVTLALNNAKPAYRVTLMGAIYAQADNDKTADEIVKVVKSAVEKVKKNPGHAKV